MLHNDPQSPGGTLSPPQVAPSTLSVGPTKFSFWFLLFSVFICNVSGSDAEDHRIMLDPHPKFNLTSIQFPKDEFIAQIQSFDHSLFVVVTSKEMKIYKLMKGRELVFKGSFLHHIQNAYDEHVFSYCTHGYVAFLKKYTMYFFRLSEEKDSLQYNLTYPNSYFGVRWFSDVIGVSPWNNTVYMQTGERQVTMFDFRDVYHPTSKAIPITEGLEGINILSVIDKGRALAVFYTNSLEIINIAQGESFKTIKLYRLTDSVIRAEYNQYSNRLVYIFSRGRAGTMKVERETDYERNNFNTMLGPDKMEDIRKIGIIRTGMGITALIYSHIVEYRDLMDSKLTSIDKVELPKDLQEKDYHFSTSIRLSNILVARNDKSESIAIKFLWMKSSHPFTCHPTCRFGCQVPFQPCSGFPIIMLSFLIASLSLLIVIYLFRFIVGYLEQRRNRSLSSKDISIGKLFAKNKTVVAKAKDSVVVTIDTRNAPPSIMNILYEEFGANLPDSSFVEDTGQETFTSEKKPKAKLTYAASD